MTTIALKDGRKLEIETAGNNQGRAVIFHHGTPGASSTWKSWLTEVANQGGFAISYSRPGYGDSSRNAGRSVISNTENILAIIEHFNLKEIVSIGWSGGGPHALADTTLIQSRGAISIAGVGPYGAASLNFLEGMGEENHVEFGAAVQGEAAINTWMLENAPGLTNVTGPDLIEAFGGLIGDADKAALVGGVADEMAASFRQSQANGHFGWMDDDLAFVKPWGFDISEINKPVQLWQGNDDLMVPHAHGIWLANHIPVAELIMIDGEGHISLGENRRGHIVKNALELFD